MWVAGVTAGTVLLAAPALAQEAQRFTFRHPAMGTEFRIVLYAADSGLAEHASAEAFGRIDRLDRVLSDYRAESESMRLSATAGSGAWVGVSADLWAALDHADRMSRATDGAFDATVGPLTRLWRWSYRRGVLPGPDRIARARAAVGYQHLELDRPCRRARLLLPGMRLDFGGIGKGIAADAALAALTAAGVTSALVDAGGDIVVSAAPPGATGWRVVVPVVRDGRMGTDTIEVTHRAVATSGARYRYLDVDGVRYSHIVDPATGLGLTARRVVTVEAPTAAEADAWATAASVGSGGGGGEVSVRVMELVGGEWVVF